MIINIYGDGSVDERVGQENQRAPSGVSWHNHCKKDPDNVGGCCDDLQTLCIDKCDDKFIDDGNFDGIGCIRDCDSAWSDCAAVLEDETDPTLKEQAKKTRKSKKT